MPSGHSRIPPMTKPLNATLLALSTIAFLLTGCLGGGGGSTQPNNSSGVHESAPSPDGSVATPGPDSDVVVGVTDSGFRLTHETIEPSLIKATNLIDGSTDVSGDEDHGTAIASLVTQAPSLTGLLLAKVSDDDNAGLAATNVLDYSVGYLATECARVINHSWSGRIDAPDPAASYRGVNALTSLEQIITSNDGLGSVYVVAAGNDGQPLQSSNPIHQHVEIFERMLIVGGSTRDANDELILDPPEQSPR